ncbi:MAG: ComF family protein [Acidimicrobiia bacterium]|nr:ComF family protein [Acidimicrobiia bacterium]
MTGFAASPGSLHPRAAALGRLAVQAADGLLAVMLAPRCAACDAQLDSPTGGPVCADCWAAVRPIPAPWCDRCGDPLTTWRTIGDEPPACTACRHAPGVVDRSRAAGAYDGRLRSVIHALKYDGRSGLARPLAARMQAAGQDVLAGATCVVPVPLHPWRRLRRGFNQASELSRHLGLPVVHALWRIRATSQQTGLTAAGRRRNVHGAFVLSPWLRTRRARDRWIAGRPVVLVDDVRTTGATIEACARVLKAAGAAEVRALTAARATPPG